MAKKRKKKSAHKSRRKKVKKNPESITVYAKKGKKKFGSKTTSRFSDQAELKQTAANAAKLQHAARLLKGKKNKKKKKALKAAAKRAKTTLKILKNKRKSEIKHARDMASDLKAARPDLKVSKKTNYFGGGKTVAKKKRKKKASRKSKKKSHKRKAAKKTKHVFKAKKRRSKKRSRKMKKHVAVAHAPKKSKKRRSKKRRSSKLVTVKGKFMGKFKRNPIGGGSGRGLKVAGYTVSGYDGLEIGALIVGGATYGAINGALPKIPVLGQVQAMLMRVPVIGSSLTPIVVGAAINALAEKYIKNPDLKKYLSVFGDGLIGASVVGLGVNLSQYVPGLAPTLSGVDYTPNMGDVNFTPNMGLIPSGLGNDADFGSVDYFPGMGDVNFTPNMGADPDFGAQADFGIVPDGLGDYSEQLG